jgi:type I restriction enzyme S subunit
VVIPADWKEVALCKVADIGPGINKALSEMGSGSLYVTVEDIYHGSFLDAERLGRIRISKSEVERFSLQIGDLVLGKSSVKRDGIGYPNLFLGCAEPVVPSGFTYRVRPDRSLLSSKFLLQYLRSRPGRKWIIDNSQSSALTNINSSIVNRYPILLPPLKEQEVIAEALSDADAAIESLDALIAKKRDVKQATMQQLLTGRTRLPGFTADWKEVRLGDILGYEQPTKYLVNSSDYVEGGKVPVLTAGKSFLLGYTDDADGIYTNLPTIIFDDFTTATQWVDFEFKVKSSACKMLRPKNGACNPRYVFERLRALNYQTSDHKRHWISVFHSMEMLMPPLKEQEAIAEALTVMDDELEVLTEQVSKLRMVKEGMMQDLLTGKVRLV